MKGWSIDNAGRVALEAGANEQLRAFKHIGAEHFELALVLDA